MLETCQKHHMFLGLGLLVATTIIVLIIESRFADTTTRNRNRTQPVIIENNSTCWMREKYTIVEECHPIAETDIVTQSVVSAYKEVIRCANGETITRSCDREALIERRKFIQFEIACLAIGILSYLVSYTRDRFLSRRTTQKIEKQLNRVR